MTRTSTHLAVIVAFGLIAVRGWAASYQVPATVELLPYAQWDIGTHADAKIENGVLSGHYQLPSDLVGEGNGHIRFTGKVEGDFAKVTGSHVEGTCMLSAQKPMTCLLKYPEMAIDVEARDRALTANHMGDELELRSRVSRLFSADPAGLLTVDVAGARW